MAKRPNTAVVVLAAGKGTRMNSAIPKVMQPLGDRSLLCHVLDSALAQDASQVIVVLGDGQDDIRDSVRADFSGDISFAIQPEQRGTGDALHCACEPLKDNVESVLVVYGDVPLIDAEALSQLIDLVTAGKDSMALMVTECRSKHNSYGRIIHDESGNVREIVEYRDCTPAQREILRVSAGVMSLPRRPLERWLSALRPNNKQAERYLTDVVAMARADNFTVREVQVPEDDVQGVNTMQDLARLERIYARRRAQALLDAGVRLHDPDRLDCRGRIEHGRDVRIDVNCLFAGHVRLGDGVVIGANCVIIDCAIADGTHILPFTHLEGAEVGRGCRIGPFARLRPSSSIADEARIGNFVEVKNSEVKQGAKASHLSYIGDTTIGANSNIGAGTITCNYDGSAKHRTTIGDGAFIGSGAMLVAPINIGDGAIIGAGSILRRDVPADSLEVSSPPTIRKEGYASTYWRRRAAKSQKS